MPKYSQAAMLRLCPCDFCPVAKNCKQSCEYHLNYIRLSTESGWRANLAEFNKIKGVLE